MNIFNENGYLDIKQILTVNVPFIFVIGARGVGKTYGALKYVKDEGLRFIYMRRTQSQLDLVNKPEFCPFKSINENDGCSIGSKPLSKYNAGFYHMDKDENGIEHAVGLPLGYSMALSTVSNLRGFDASDVKVLIWDEFIPERHERPIKEEADAFLNAYETMNRNRELKGEKPLQALFLANSNTADNPMFIKLKLVRKVEQMKKTGQMFSILKDRGIALFLISNSPISKAKSETALYKLAGESSFSRMALENEFADLGNSAIKPQPLGEYRAVVNVGELTVYKHKSKACYYVTPTASGCNLKYGTSDLELSRFCKTCYYLIEAYFRDKILFEDSESMFLFEAYIR